MFITECCRIAKVADMSLAPSLIQGPVLFRARAVVQLQSLPSQHQWLPSKSSTVVVDEEKERDYSP